MPRRRAVAIGEGFPDPALAHPSGLLAVGGDLSPRRLLAAYASGIFPWYSEEEPVLWWSPDPRFLLDLDRLHVPRSLARTIRRGLFEVRADTAFERVIDRCARKRRPGQRGTWITGEMRDAYVELHRLGFAHSVESFHDGRLAGAIYGVAIGGAFAGESMFADRPDASKVALVRLVEALRAWGFDFLDCQVWTANLDRFGARDVPRALYLERLAAAVARPSRAGPWTDAFEAVVRPAGPSP